MNYSTIAAAIPIARTGSKLLRGTTLAATAQGVGAIIAAAVLAAVYQLVQEEAHGIVNAMRNRSRFRYARHDSLIMEAFGAQLQPEIQYRLLSSRNALRTCLRLLTDPMVERQDKEVIRQMLRLVRDSHSA